MQIEIFEADEVADVGRDLIEAYHPHLAEAHIRFLFTSKRRTKCGRVVLGTAQKASGLTAFFSQQRDDMGALRPADFIILVSYGEWGALNEAGRRALVDHELLHCGMNENDDGSPEWTINGHDVEAFVDEIERHGLWRQDLVNTAAAIEQMRLPLEQVRA
jgi:hypothetical protein